MKLLAPQVAAADPKGMRTSDLELKDRLGAKALIGLAATNSEGKAMLLVIVGPDLAERFKAGSLVAEMAVKVSGKGGGRADMAQAGGPDGDKISDALEVLTKLVN